MKLKFWGVRGSIPSPLSPQIIKDKIAQTLKRAALEKIDLQNSIELENFISNLPLESYSTIGGNTTCITIETDNNLIIFDAGSGMRELGRYLMTREFGRGKGHAHIFFTHTHWDHIQGFPFFVPAFITGNQFDIYHLHHYVPQVLENQMVSEVFPAQFGTLPSQIRFHQLQEGQTITLGNLEIVNKQLQHPGQAYAYRVSNKYHTIVLATDGEYKQLDSTSLKQYIDFYYKADVLIFDAQFSMRESVIKEDWGHSSALIGVDIARDAKVKQLILFHHDPTSSDQEIMAVLKKARDYIAHSGKSMPARVDVAKENLEINFNKPYNFTITQTEIAHTICLTLAGQFNAKASEVFTKHILNSIPTNEPQKIILNMVNLTDLTMAGIRALLDARRNIYSMALINIPDSIYHVLELSGTTDFFAIYNTIDDALNAH